jgi:hypothetical protein
LQLDAAEKQLDKLKTKEKVTVQSCIERRNERHPESEIISEYSSKFDEIKQKYCDPLWLPVLWCTESRSEAFTWILCTADRLITQLSREKRTQSSIDFSCSLITKASALPIVLSNIEEFWENLDFNSRTCLLKKLKTVTWSKTDPFRFHETHFCLGSNF